MGVLLWQLLKMLNVLLLCSFMQFTLGGVPTCNTVYDEKCWDEPRQVCNTIEVPFTTTEYVQECYMDYDRTCNTVYEDKIDYVPRKECHTVQVPKIVSVPERNARTFLRRNATPTMNRSVTMSTRRNARMLMSRFATL